MKQYLLISSVKNRINAELFACIPDARNAMIHEIRDRLASEDYNELAEYDRRKNHDSSCTYGCNETFVCVKQHTAWMTSELDRNGSRYLIVPVSLPAEKPGTEKHRTEDVFLLVHSDTKRISVSSYLDGDSAKRDMLDAAKAWLGAFNGHALEMYSDMMDKGMEDPENTLLRGSAYGTGFEISETSAVITANSYVNTHVWQIVHVTKPADVNITLCIKSNAWQVWQTIQADISVWSPSATHEFAKNDMLADFKDTVLNLHGKFDSENILREYEKICSEKDSEDKNESASKNNNASLWYRNSAYLEVTDCAALAHDIDAMKIHSWLICSI